MTSIRPAAVAGLFYPDDPGELHTAVTQYLSDAQSDAKFQSWTPKAIIVDTSIPHPSPHVPTTPFAASPTVSTVSSCWAPTIVFP